MNPAKALLVATIAHAAKGQTRGNGVPYIVHPKRVALLTETFMRRYWSTEIGDQAWLDDGSMKGWNIDDLAVASYLHDTIEDTGITRQHLLDAGIQYHALDIVERLTKPNPHGKAPPSYYQGIAEHTGALVVKAADRCANLEDAFKDLLVPGEFLQCKRWRNYVAETYEYVLPMYVTLPSLAAEIKWRADRIVKFYPTARARRDAYILRVDADHAKRKTWSVLEGKRRPPKVRGGRAA